VACVPAPTRLAQVIRNLAQQESLAVRRRFGPYIEQLVMLLKVGTPGSGCLTHCAALLSTSAPSHDAVAEGELLSSRAGVHKP